MEHIELLYRPKGTELLYQEFRRPSGYTGRIIHMHDAHEICFIASGSECLLFSGGNQQTVHGPAILLHRAGSYHELLSVEENSVPYDSKVVYFRHEQLPPSLLPPGLLDADCRILPLTDPGPFLPYFELIKHETGHRQMLAVAMVLSRMGEGTSISLNAVDSYIFDVIKFISEHLGEDLTVRELAGRFHVSESKLKQDFSATAGTTLKRFTTALRLRQAQSLLQTTVLDIADIAYRCGFSGESHFIEAFRNHLGITPGKFRKRGKDYV